MTKIYLIRHAEAEGNLYRRVQGHYDGDITARGWDQISLLAKRFKDIKIDALYASDLRRTQKTAQAILKYHDLKLNIEPRLKEIGMGVWEDQPWGNVAYDDPIQMSHFVCDACKWDVEGGEKFADLRRRITGIILELAERHEGETIACFSHGMAIRTFISAVKELPLDRMQEIQHGDNTCVAYMAVDKGRIELHYYNDRSHLPDECSTFAKQQWWKKSDQADFSNLRIVPMNLREDSKLYSQCYRDGWEASHGTMRGYSDEPYLRGAETVSGKNPLLLMKAFSGEKFAGIIELNPDRMSEEGAGWISFLYLTPEFRRMGLGVQLIGHAVSFFRSLGRNLIRLHVAETNKAAIAFYEKYGFKRIGSTKGNLCSLLLMEKKF